MTLRLHCAAIPERPGGTVPLAMELDVPAGAPVGNTWMLVARDGRVVIAGPADGGVPVEITG